MTQEAQEFYCGECRTYFIIKLNMALESIVFVVCPGCEHEHQRSIRAGRLTEEGRHESTPTLKIRALKSTMSKTPLTEAMQRAHETHSYQGRRCGIPVPPPMYDRWLEVAAREKGLIDADD